MEMRENPNVKLKRDGMAPNCTSCNMLYVAWILPEISGVKWFDFFFKESASFSLDPSQTHPTPRPLGFLASLWFSLVFFFVRPILFLAWKWKVLASLPEDGTASHPTWQTGENLLCSFILQSPSKTCFLHFLTASLTSFDPSTPSQYVGILVSECTITLVLPTSLYTEKQHENIANCWSSKIFLLLW